MSTPSAGPPPIRASDGSVENAAGLDVSVEEISDDLAALALQGPTSAAILHAVADVDIAGLKYFRMARGRIAGVPVDISRTGYTGDLGYELWIPRDRAIEVWDALMAAGSPYGIRPVGMLALDVARTEAGLLLIDVDFHGSRKALIESHSYSPFELGLGRLVQLDKRPFVGRTALVAEKRTRAPAPDRRSGDWLGGGRAALRAARHAATTAADGIARAVPVYKSGRQIGKATTTTWSPSLKKLIALATLEAPHFTPGTAVDFELTVDAVRHRVPATVVATPFFNPPRKTAAPALTPRS